MEVDLRGNYRIAGKRMGKGSGGRKLRNIISAIIVIVPSRMTGSSLIHFSTYLYVEEIF